MRRVVLRLKREVTVRTAMSIIGLSVACGSLPLQAQTSGYEQPAFKRYYVTLSDGSAVPDVEFEMHKPRGDRPVMTAVSKNDSTDVLAKFYFFNNPRAKESSCIGYDGRGKAFVIELRRTDDFRTGKDLLDMASAFLNPYTAGTIYYDVPLQYICSAASIGDVRAVAILDKAADKSRGKLKKKLPSLKMTKYDIQRDYWELEAHGDFNPFDFQIVNLKNDFISRQAKRFGYTQSVDRESIMRRIADCDGETLEFVSAHLKIDDRKKK